MQRVKLALPGYGVSYKTGRTDFIISFFSYGIKTTACTCFHYIILLMHNANICGLSVSMFLFNIFTILLHKFNKCRIIYSQILISFRMSTNHLSFLVSPWHNRQRTTMMFISRAILRQAHITSALKIILKSWNVPGMICISPGMDSGGHTS